MSGDDKDYKTLADPTVPEFRLGHARVIPLSVCADVLREAMRRRAASPDAEPFFGTGVPGMQLAKDDE